MSPSDSQSSIECSQARVCVILSSLNCLPGLELALSPAVYIHACLVVVSWCIVYLYVVLLYDVYTESLTMLLECAMLYHGCTLSLALCNCTLQFHEVTCAKQWIKSGNTSPSLSGTHNTWKLSRVSSNLFQQQGGFGAWSNLQLLIIDGLRQIAESHSCLPAHLGWSL